MAQVACEVFVTTRLAVVGGEISKGRSPTSRLDDTVRRIGYDGFDPGFAWVSSRSRTGSNRSPDISDGVDRELGAGDQGSCSASPSMRPPS